jgi:hypothetical protein
MPDGLTPDHQLAIAFDPKFERALTWVAVLTKARKERACKWVQHGSSHKTPASVKNHLRGDAQPNVNRWLRKQNSRPKLGRLEVKIHESLKHDYSQIADFYFFPRVRVFCLLRMK